MLNRKKNLGLPEEQRMAILDRAIGRVNHGGHVVTAIQQALEILARGEAEFLHKPALPTIELEINEARAQRIGWRQEARLEAEMNKAGWVRKYKADNDVRYFQEQVNVLNQNRHLMLKDIGTLQDLNDQLREVVEKLRSKLVEQDEVIGKLAILLARRLHYVEV
jgi:hypothetical protein